MSGQTNSQQISAYVSTLILRTKSIYNKDTVSYSYVRSEHGNKLNLFIVKSYLSAARGRKNLFRETLIILKVKDSQAGVPGWISMFSGK